MARYRKTKLSKKLKEQILRRDGYRCYVCGAVANENHIIESTGSRVEVDHFIPELRGGSSRPENLRCICNRCNSRKGADSPLSRFFLLWMYRHERIGKKITFPKPLFYRLEMLAKKEGLSLTSLICALLIERVVELEKEGYI